MKKFWTKKEVDYLIKNYRTETWEELKTAFPGRSKNSLEKKAHRLKLKREDDFWTEEEDKYFKEHYSTASWEELLKALPNRSKIGIKQRAIKVFKLKRELKNWDLDLFGENTLWSDEKAWALGIIWSDGCLSQKDYISLSSIDLELIEQYKNVLQLKEKIKVLPPFYKKFHSHVCKTKTLYTVGFSSKRMANDLRRLGCHACKSRTIDYPNELPDEYFWSFFRGLIDGDGCICMRKNNNFTVSLITASEKLKNSLILRFDRLGVKHNTPKLHKNDNVYRIRILAPSWREVYYNMYSDDHVPCLYRKREKFQIGVNRKIRIIKKV